jgi:hypothetical protein
MPDQFGGIETDQFGGVRVGEPQQRDQFGGIRVGYPPPPRAKPEPPIPAAGQAMQRYQEAGHFKEGEETPLTRIGQATVRGAAEPFQQPEAPGGASLHEALEAHRMPGLAGTVQKYGLNPATEIGATALGAGLKGVESAFGGLTGAGGQTVDEITQAAYRAAGDNETADLIAAHPGWTARAFSECLAGLMGAEGGTRVPKPSDVAARARMLMTPDAAPARIEPIPPKMPASPAKTVLENIARGRPADAPPAAEAAPPAALSRARRRAHQRPP